MRDKYGILNFQYESYDQSPDSSVSPSRDLTIQWPRQMRILFQATMPVEYAKYIQRGVIGIGI